MSWKLGKSEYDAWRIIWLAWILSIACLLTPSLPLLLSFLRSLDAGDPRNCAELKEGALSARSPSLIGGNLDRSATPTPGNPDPSGLPSSSGSTSYPSSSTSASASGSMAAPSFPPSSSSSSSASASTSSAGGGAAHVSGYNHNPLASSTGAPISRSGLLSIAVLDARGLSLPQGQQIPPAILKALQSQSQQSQQHAQHHHHQHHHGAGGGGGGASVSGPGSLTGMFAASSLDGSGGRSGGAGAGAGGGSSNGLPPASSSSSSSSASGASLAKTAASNRHSLQRRQHWWLPYVVLEFDKNEVLIDAIGGDLASPSWVYKANFDVSRNSEISLQLYLRSSTGSGSSSSSGAGAGGKATGGGGGEGKDAQGDDVMSVSDLYLGGVKFIPDFENARGADEWFAVSGGGTGQVRIQVAFRKLDHPGASLNMEAFELLKVIGKGSFGKVMQVRKKDTGRIYALKTIRKAHIVSRSEVTHTLAERTVLARVNNPFIVPLKFSFQSPEKLYLVLAFVNGGELFHHLQREGRFNEERSRFYAAELLCALEHLHGFNVIYRDLKPENILLDYNGHIALCDFGLCKLNMGADETTNSEFPFRNSASR